MNLQISLSTSDFASYLTFQELQRKFRNHDDRFVYDSPPRIIAADIDFEIICKSIDEETNEETYDSIYFYKDFLKSNINNLAEIEIQKIETRINKDFLYNLHEKKNFINHRIDLYKRQNRFIQRSPFLNDEYRGLLLNEMTKILHFLYDDDILKNRFSENEKMKFNMNRNDIQVLFLLLRQAKIIDHPHDSDLGRLIDNFFLYHDKENEIFKEIKKSNKDLNDYKNMNKTIESSIDRLKSILSNEEFYILKV